MKNTYIIAVKEDLEPTLIKMGIGCDLCQLLSHYWRAYIFETKEKAKQVWLDWYKTYEERKQILANNQ